MLKKIMLNSILLLAALPLVGCGSSGFSEKDIVKLKTTIKEEFEKKEGI